MERLWTGHAAQRGSLSSPQRQPSPYDRDAQWSLLCEKTDGQMYKSRWTLPKNLCNNERFFPLKYSFKYNSVQIIVIRCWSKQEKTSVKDYANWLLSRFGPLCDGALTSTKCSADFAQTTAAGVEREKRFPSWRGTLSTPCARLTYFKCIQFRSRLKRARKNLHVCHTAKWILVCHQLSLQMNDTFSSGALLVFVKRQFEAWSFYSMLKFPWLICIFFFFNPFISIISIITFISYI